MRSSGATKAKAKAKPGSGARWRRRKDARPSEIAAAALECFAERGFAACSLDEIAARAGVSKGTLYLYFRNKEELFKAVMRQALLPRIALFEEKAAATDPAPRQLERFVSAWPAPHCRAPSRRDPQAHDRRGRKLSRSLSPLLFRRGDRPRPPPRRRHHHVAASARRIAPGRCRGRVLLGGGAAPHRGAVEANFRAPRQAGRSMSKRCAARISRSCYAAWRGTGKTMRRRVIILLVLAAAGGARLRRLSHLFPREHGGNALILLGNVDVRQVDLSFKRRRTDRHAVRR